MKKFRLLVLLLALFPAGAGAVLLPIGFGLGIVTGIASTSLILPMIASSLVVGAALTWITIGATPTSEISQAPLQVQIDPKAPLPTPDGWTAPVAPSSEPTPPATTSNLWASYPARPSRYDQYCQAADGWTPGQIFQDGSGGAVVVVSNGPPNTYPMPPGFAWSSQCFNAGFNAGYAVSINKCPAGYSYSSGTCNITNQALVMKPADQKCSIKRTGNSYGVDAKDPDCAAGLPAEWDAGPNSISWSGKGNGDGGGSITTDAVTGETTIINKKQNTDGTTTITTIKTGAPISGAAPGVGVTVKGIAENTVQGQGSLQTNTAPGGIELPTDYNRELTQKQIKSGIDGLNTKLDATGVDATLSAEKSALDTAAQAQIDALATATNRTSSGLGFTFGFPDPGACSPLTFAIPGAAGRTLVIDWCPAQAPIKSIGSFIVSLFAAMYLFSLGTSLFNRT